MINYSIVMRGNPGKKDDPKKAYAASQYSDVMELDEFASHIASHGCVYSRADIMAILTMSVDCMREQLLAGKKIRMGDLGDFSLSLRSEGVEKAADFVPATHVKQVNVRWTPGKWFQDLKAETEFNLVPTRHAAKAVVKALKAGETSVDLTVPTTGGGKLPEEEGPEEPLDPGDGEEDPIV